MRRRSNLKPLDNPFSAKLGMPGLLSLRSKVINPIKSAAIQNRLPASTASNASYKNVAFRVPYMLVGDQSELCISTLNWIIGGAGQADIATVTTISEASYEYNGATVPYEYSASRSLAMAAGANDVLSDIILPSDFGPLTKFVGGQILWLKGLLSVPANGNSIPTASYYSDLTGSQCFWYNPANTTVSSTDAAGVYTTTGTAPVAISGMFMPILLGRQINRKTVVGGVGDSKTDGTGDVANQGALGRGYYFNSIRGADGVPTNAGLSMARGGASIGAFTGSNTKWLAYLKYVDAVLYNLGTNDFNSAITAATCWTRTQGLLSIIAANGIPRNKIVVCELGVQTTCPGANGYVDEAGQAVANSRWDAGGEVMQYEAILAADNGVNFKTFVAFPDTHGTVNNRLWFADGTFGGRTTGDGIHAGYSGPGKQAAYMRPVVATL